MASASVVTTSKYSKALPPTRPTFFMSSMPAMPTTMVQKMIGVIIIFTSLMKPSPSGFSLAPNSGIRCPRVTPSTMATMTWKYRLL
ncbi:hypothetical protein D3C78_1534730 [compost metagenome]